jgi:DNA repair photolyase
MESKLCLNRLMRWAGQEVSDQAASDPAALPGLDRLHNLVRTVRTPEFAGITFHEVLAKSALNKVPAASAVPFNWTVNPYRGCSHACVYCFARGTHTYLDLDAGEDFDRQIIVKINVADVLARELRRPSWTHEPVALGTNTDPYQRAEGRYRLMPGIIAGLAESGTPFSILTKGTTARRDLGLLSDAAENVAVGMGVSIALMNETVHEALEPGTPTPRARLELVRSIVAAGLPCQVLVAPVLPMITDSDEQLDRLLCLIAAAGATGATVFALHLRPGAREWFWRYLGRFHPQLVNAYAELYRGGSYVSRSYATDLARRSAALVRKHRLQGSAGATPRWPSSRAGPGTQGSPAAVPSLF